jgi:hypothetical protein
VEATSRYDAVELMRASGLLSERRSAAPVD